MTITVNTVMLLFHATEKVFGIHAGLPTGMYKYHQTKELFASYIITYANIIDKDLIEESSTCNIYDCMQL